MISPNTFLQYIAGALEPFKVALSQSVMSLKSGVINQNSDSDNVTPDFSVSDLQVYSFTPPSVTINYPTLPENVTTSRGTMIVRGGDTYVTLLLGPGLSRVPGGDSLNAYGGQVLELSFTLIDGVGYIKSKSLTPVML